MEYPRFVYTAPGPNQCQGGTYGQELVRNEAEHDAALKAGFKDGIPDALRAYKESQTPKTVVKKESDPAKSKDAEGAKPKDPASDAAKDAAKAKVKDK